MLVTKSPSGGNWRASVVLVPGVAISLVALIGFQSLPQDPVYHGFADQRALYGMPHFWNVVSNVPFALVGLLGCWWIIRAGSTSPAFEDPRERLAYLVFFAGEFLTCFGSGYYHSGPSNQTLVWDRLMFSLMLTSIFSIIVSEFVDRRVGRLMLAPIVLVGLASVLYWSYTEMHGRGDVRFYAVVQFYPVLVMPFIFLLCQSRYTHARFFAFMWALYAAAKGAELYDQQLYDWSGVVSGHTIKHFVAAGASSLPLYALTRRLPLRADRRARPRSGGRLATVIRYLLLPRQYGS